jgi:hypothetical protein
VSLDDEVERLWAREDFVRVTGVVTRVGTTLLGVELPRPHGRHTFPWQGPPLRVGDRVTVAGEPAGGLFRPFRPIIVRVRPAGLLGRLGMGKPTLVVIPQSDRVRAAAVAAAASKPQPWLDVLVRHGLLDAASDVGPKLYAADPAGVLFSIHAPRAAIARGFVHYDAAWGNDTDDLIGDLAALAGHGGTFPQIRADEDDDIELIAGRVNAWLEALDTDRRIWTLETGQDRWAFLARSPDEVAAMQQEGLPTTGWQLARLTP